MPFNYKALKEIIFNNSKLNTLLMALILFELRKSLIRKILVKILQRFTSQEYMLNPSGLLLRVFIDGLQLEFNFSIMT
jgi:hypothetical protein